jgi:hypothetical protein
MATNDPLDIVVAQWAALGVLFDAEPAPTTPDVERLLLGTAQHAPAMPRLFEMASTWLHFYGDLVAKHRLKRLIRDELAPEHGPVLGLLLDIAQEGSHPPEFQSVVRILHPAPKPRPLFDVQREPTLAALAKRTATERSRAWNLWCPPMLVKLSAIRPSWWMMARNPELILRADFRGDLRASIISSLRHDAEAGTSELRLAAMAGGSRAQVRAALRNLEMTGRVAVRPAPGSNRREISLTTAA